MGIGAEACLVGEGHVQLQLVVPTASHPRAHPLAVHPEDIVDEALGDLLRLERRGPLDALTLAALGEIVDRLPDVPLDRVSDRKSVV